MWGGYGEWSQYCTKSCGGGQIYRSRRKAIEASNGGKRCEGDSIEAASCNTDACPVDCVWGKYGQWSDCSKTCGGGEKTRSRSKTIEASDGGQECQGEATETVTCNIDSCPIDCVWGNYGEWSDCSQACEKTRSRSKTTEASNGGKECQGEATDTATCSGNACRGN